MSTEINVGEFNLINGTSCFVRGQWYEVEITDCKTHVIFRDKLGKEVKFYNDDEDARLIREFIMG